MEGRAEIAIEDKRHVLDTGEMIVYLHRGNTR